MRHGRFLAAIAALMLLLSGLIAAPLGAQSTAVDGSDFEVLRVDLAGGSGLVAFRPSANLSAESELVVDIGGEEVVAGSLNAVSNTRIDQYTIIVVDNSETANQITGWGQIRSAALAYLDSVTADTEVMLVLAGDGNLEIRPEVPFTTDHAAVRRALNDTDVGSASITWNAIADSTRAFAGAGEGLRNVVVFAGSPAGASTISPSLARGNLLTANAALTVVGPETANLDLSEFRNSTTAVRGGIFLRGTAEANMTAAAGVVGEIHRSTRVGQFDTSNVVTIDQANEEGRVVTSQLTFRIDGESERVRVVTDGVTAGSGLVPPALVETSRFDILNGGQGILIAIALAVIAALLFSYSMFSIFAGDDDTLNSTLSVYGPQDGSDAAAADAEFQSQRAKIIEQVVERAEEAAASRGNLTSTTSLLEKAEIPLRVGEAFAIQVGIIVVALVLGFLISGGSIIFALILGVIAGIAPMAYIKFKVGRRSKKLESQLPDTLNLLASTLKAGYSFVQGMDAVGNEGDEPLAGEFRRTVNEARLGKDLDIALDDLAERVDSVDLLWAIVAIKIQREVGGNLAELLSTVADTMTARTRLRGEVAALTAEGRVSAIVLLFLPFGVGLAMFFLNRAYISLLWQSTIGYAAMGVAMFSMFIGALWMRKIIDIEI